MEKLPVGTAWCKVIDNIVYDNIENKSNQLGEKNELKSKRILSFFCHRSAYVVLHSDLLSALLIPHYPK